MLIKSSNESSPTSSVYEDNIISARVTGIVALVTSMASLLIAVVALPSCALNLIANSLHRRDAYTYYLVGMSVADGLDLVIMVLTTLMELLVPKSSFAYNFTVVYISVGAATVVRRAAIVLNSLASVERFLTLIFPFKRSINILNRYPRLIIISVYGNVFLFHVSILLELSVTKIKEEVWTFTPSALRLENEQLFLVLQNVARGAAFYGPLIISLIINTALIVALKLHVYNQRDIRTSAGTGALQKETTNGGEQKGHVQRDRVTQTCRLVLALSFSFFVLALPRTLSSNVGSFLAGYSYFSRSRNLIYVVNAFASLPQYLTEPCLLLISCGLSTQFRKTVRSQLCCSCEQIVAMNFREREVISDLADNVTLTTA